MVAKSFLKAKFAVLRKSGSFKGKEGAFFRCVFHQGEDQPLLCDLIFYDGNTGEAQLAGVALFSRVSC